MIGSSATDQKSGLAERVRAGDAAAEQELVQRYSRGVRVILRNAGADWSVVDDLHQETFRIGLEKIRNGDLRNPSVLGSFIASLARNLATDHFRRRATSETKDPAKLETLQSAEVGILERLVEREQTECVRQLLDELSTERDREILRRFYLSAEEKGRICEDLKLSGLQFNRVLFRARQRFKELYEIVRRRRDS
jgi:RNA polymerase sigma-70 factor (ECF subfamily)